MVYLSLLVWPAMGLLSILIIEIALPRVSRRMLASYDASPSMVEFISTRRTMRTHLIDAAKCILLGPIGLAFALISWRLSVMFSKLTPPRLQEDDHHATDHEGGECQPCADNV